MSEREEEFQEPQPETIEVDADLFLESITNSLFSANEQTPWATPGQGDEGLTDDDSSPTSSNGF